MKTPKLTDLQRGKERAFALLLNRKMKWTKDDLRTYHAVTRRVFGRKFTRLIAILAMAISGAVSAAVVPPFNITLSGPFDNPEDTNIVYYIAATTQFSNNVCVIEQSNDDLFNFAASATWFCYPKDQQVAGIFFVARGEGDKFYRAVNTPCPLFPEGVFAPASIQMVSMNTVPKSLQKWRTKQGYRLGPELIGMPAGTSGTVVRRFILTAPIAKTPPPLPPALPGLNGRKAPTPPSIQTPATHTISLTIPPPPIASNLVTCTIHVCPTCGTILK